MGIQCMPQLITLTVNGFNSEREQLQHDANFHRTHYLQLKYATLEGLPSK